jgi:hypothetical protein
MVIIFILGLQRIITTSWLFCLCFWRGEEGQVNLSRAKGRGRQWLRHTSKKKQIKRNDSGMKRVHEEARHPN